MVMNFTSLFKIIYKSITIPIIYYHIPNIILLLWVLSSVSHLDFVLNTLKLKLSEVHMIWKEYDEHEKHNLWKISLVDWN